MIKIDGLILEEIRDLVNSLGEPTYRGDQIYKWVYSKAVNDFDMMSDLSKEFRKKIKEVAAFTDFTLLELKESKRDLSLKGLFLLEDGEKIESVILKDADRHTLCVSTQVGCRMGCKFCNTAQVGFKRDLTTSEIIRQVLFMKKVLEDKGGKLTNIVYMGMGEPLDNIDNVIRSLEILTDENGVGFSHRKITVSTSGVVNHLDKLFSMKKVVNLAVSLNATTDGVRSRIMPINNRFPINTLLSKLKQLPLQKRKRITIEYVMLKGVNDTIEDAKRVVQLLKGLPVKINLIVYNQTIGGEYKSSDEDVVLNFQKYLTDRNFTVFIRKSLAADIDGACGQLYAKYI
ncbi:MAG: 23S rRNA (adenine(2503)-C(2))-methyltransferase RlmN [Deferribacterales bacterium]